MGAVVTKLRQSFTICAEVGIMADGALVPVTLDITILAIAKRTITEDSGMVLRNTTFHRHWLVEWYQTMSWMICVSIFDT